MITAEELLRDKGRELIGVSPDASIRDALKVMVEKKIGSILIKENGKVAGIWTERDFMQNILSEGFDLDRSRVGDYMTTKLQYARISDPLHILMDKFLGLGIRHLLIEKNGECVGVLSTRDVVRSNLHEKFQELKKENAETSWEYYENWKWTPGS
ncbi:cyclic nucleotide-binding/CBS domain-containing protein [Fibrobacterota bacterium]